MEKPGYVERKVRLQTTFYRFVFPEYISRIDLIKNKQIHVYWGFSSEHFIIKWYRILEGWVQNYKSRL